MSGVDIAIALICGGGLFCVIAISGIEDEEDDEDDRKRKENYRP